MSSLRKEAIAVLCSDIHLSHKCPVARSPEDWYEAQGRALEQLATVSYDSGGIPIICAGDVFDKWNSPPELINWALDNLPEMYAIPGQHDLPHHNLEDIEKSAYWTLVKSGKIINIHDFEIIELKKRKKTDGHLWLYGYPWGRDLQPLGECDGRREVTLAVVHKYVWKKGKSYPGAKKEDKINNFISTKLEGYDAAIFGDNHKSFLIDGWNVLNCGTLMRRKADEFDYEPHVGVLFRDGHIERVKLDTSEDKFIDVGQAVELVERALDMTQFIQELAALGQGSLDFIDAVKRFLDENNIDLPVRKLVTEAIDGG